MKASNLSKFLYLLMLGLPIINIAHAQNSNDEQFQRFLEREAIEQVISQANLGYELFDADLFAGAFAEDATFELDSDVPVFAYQQLIYQGRAEIRSIVQSRVDSQANADPSTMSYDSASLRRYNRNSNSYITLIDETHARHIANWMVVMKTNINIHTSAIGRYEDELEKRDGQWYIIKRLRIE